MNTVLPIEAVQVVDETDNKVKLLNGHVIHKNTETVWVRPTFAEAKACLVGYYERKIIDYTNQLKYAERNLESARKLEEPK